MSTAWTFLRLLGGCFQAVLLLVVLAGTIGYILRRVSLFRFKRRYRGRWLFVAGSRHGWYDFVRNNVVPVLPADTEVVLSRWAAPTMLTTLRWLRVDGSKPLLVHITQRREVKHTSLHEQLLPLRQHAARDPDVQREVASIIAGHRAQMLTGSEAKKKTR